MEILKTLWHGICGFSLSNNLVTEMKQNFSIYTVSKMKSLKIIFMFLLTATVAVLIILFNGCSDGVAPQSGNFQMSVQSQKTMAKTTADSLQITSAKILLKNLRLKGVASSDSASMNDSSIVFNDDDESDEVELKMGPFVVSLSLSGSVNPVTVNNVAAGTYVGAKFDIHRLEEGEAVPDSAFIDTTNGMDTYSVVVKGFYNNVPFVFKSRVSAHQDVYFAQPVVVTKTGFVNVTLTVDPYSWFVLNGQTIDPANPANREMIDMQIRHSFREGFEDDHEDGHIDVKHD